jgi:formamidopyrimidine-DNA glycosylase
VPELPEVETVRRGLAPVMEGRTIDAVGLARADLRFPFPPRFAERLTGRRILSLGRRAKYLLAPLDDGTALIAHLGMSGAFRVEDDALAAAAEGGPAPIGRFVHPKGKIAAHDHVILTLGGTRIVYNDPRRFGFMDLGETAALQAHPFFAHLGMEPVAGSLTPDRLAAALKGKMTPLKSALLDQRVIAGLGNIYVCEALWRARLSPRRLAGSVVRKDGMAGQRVTRLAGAIVAVIAEAIEAGGSSLRDYVAADGSLGRFQHTFAVYGKEGEPCPRLTCPGTVARIVQTGRSTFFCPQCQR